MLRAIHLFPDTRAWPQIERLRQQHDWLQPCLPAHLTLVFPFELPEVSDEAVLQHCQAVVGEFQAFTVTLLPPVRSADDHGWLPAAPHPGLRALATRLHSGPLAALAPTRRAFQPHITLARPPLPVNVIWEDVAAQWSQLWPSAGPVTLAVDALTLEAIHADHRSEALGCLHLRR